MEYRDEQIAEELNKGKKGVSGNIYDGVYIKEELYTFSEKTFFDDTFSIMLPDAFGLMDEELKKQKFLAENRPPYIYSSMDTSVTFAMNRTNSPLMVNNLSSTVRQIKQLIRNSQPANSFYDKKTVNLDQIDYGWFDFKGYALDGPIYYVNAFPIVNNKMYHVSFSCPFREMDNWKPVVLQVLESMKDLTRKTGKQG